MNPFQFNQPEDKSCGWRCLYSLIPEKIEYKDFLSNFKYLSPGKNGIKLSTIQQILNYYGIKTTFEFPREKGIYLFWAKCDKWNFAGGHYFLYINGQIYDTKDEKPYEMTLNELNDVIKSDSTNYICLKID